MSYRILDRNSGELSELQREMRFNLLNTAIRINAEFYLLIYISQIKTIKLTRG